MMGTWINMATVFLGSGLGVLLGGRLPERFRDITMRGLGLLVLVVGMQMALETENILIVMGGILMGGLIGEGMNIQRQLDRLGHFLQARFGTGEGSRFSEGFVTASLVFCVGPMTFMGALQDGLTGDYHLLAIKATLDGFAGLAFAAAMGVGVMFSVVTVLVVQGGISLGAGLLHGVLTDAMIREMTACGGLMVLGIGFMLLDLLQLRVANYLPALVVAPLLVAVIALLPF